MGIISTIWGFVEKRRKKLKVQKGEVKIEGQKRAGMKSPLLTGESGGDPV